MVSRSPHCLPPVILSTTIVHHLLLVHGPDHPLFCKRTCNAIMFAFAQQISHMPSSPNNYTYKISTVTESLAGLAKHYNSNFLTHNDDIKISLWPTWRVFLSCLLPAHCHLPITQSPLHVYSSPICWHKNNMTTRNAC